MTTLQAIGFTVAGGTIVFVGSFCLFGVAMSLRHDFIAPRCTARPKDVIYNPKPKHSSQHRGNAMLGWISWTMNLSYDTMLKGVPGTGTRKGGLAGSLLNTNLDGVVLLRFHTLCYKVSVLATFLCLALILPMNYSARCYQEQQQNHTTNTPGCAQEVYNLTNYDRTTLANIPALNSDTADVETIWGLDFTSLLGRMYGIILCSWMITIFTCYLLRREWMELLAMRRVYYLEFDHWKHRRDELEATLLYDDDSDEEEQSSHGKTNGDQKVDRMRRRDPWIPHPEQRETVPNVALYSVLVGGLPSLPQQEVPEEDLEATVGYSKRLSIDWQLALTTSFFDQCVPNQPGFSSSVAAVTILPAASDLARAWGKWYAAAAKLRRLRYIRRLIADLRHYDIDENESDDDGSPSQRNSKIRSRELSGRQSQTIYSDPDQYQSYYKDVLGSTVDEEVETNYLLTLSFGPEQTAVYSREFAQSASACCPNGCGERNLQRTRIDVLLTMEQAAIAEVHEANRELQKAQAKVTVSEKIPDLDNSVTSDLRNDSDHRSPAQIQFKNLAMTEDLDTEAALMLRSRKEVCHSPRGSQTVDRDTHEIPAPRADAAINFNVDLGVVRRRGATGGTTEWDLVESIVQEATKGDSSRSASSQHVASGVWNWPSMSDFRGWSTITVSKLRKWATTSTTKVVDKLARDSTYAVVTFTSRQAAVAARHCLADGRGAHRWIADDSIPVPPLADAAACNMLSCRGCCRPVTMSVNEKQKLCRNYVAIILLANIYVFYTIPLTAAASLVNPSTLDNIFPGLSGVGKDSIIYSKFLSGLLPALLWTAFFGLCPTMFKSIANFGSNATSVVAAEYKALQYYWWFMVLTAFSGSSLSTMVLNGFNEGLQIGSEAQQVLANIASTIPTQISATWINWIIVRATITLPLYYMLQVNTFIYHFLGWNCCARLERGGGPGGPVPYRIYIDSGVVFLCLVALAPASPLVAPCAFVYFLICGPLLKRNVIFMYRPNFDAGGIRWAFLFDVLISSLLVGQVLLTTMMALKKALGPSIGAALPFIPTVLFRKYVRKQYLRAFLDAGLVQTSLLDGWDNRESTSMKRREEFRKFLVDAHKAAYVPVCIAGSDDVVTAEPAVVMEHDNDDESVALSDLCHSPLSMPSASTSSPPSQPNQTRSMQLGVSMRRVTPTAMRNTSAGSHFEFNVDGRNGNRANKNSMIREEDPLGPSPAPEL